MDLKTLEILPPWEWPVGSNQLLLSILRDPQKDRSDRLLAAEFAGDCVIINDELADVLVAIVGDDNESDELRARAAISLGPALEYAYMDGFEEADDVPISEKTFEVIQTSLRELYMNPNAPVEVRRRVLEGSVRAPRDWHKEAIREAYADNDEFWKLTAVFAMFYIQGFDREIMESLESKNEDIHYHAVCAAGNWGLDAAWPHIARLLTSESTDKWLRLAAIEAVPNIRPEEAAGILLDLTQSDDEDLVEAAYEAMSMSGVFIDEDFEDDDYFYEEDDYDDPDKKLLH